MAGKVTFVNKDVKSQSLKVNLFGPEKNRVKLANVLASFKATMAYMDAGSLMEADEDGLSMDSFVAGDTYTLSLVLPGLRPADAAELPIALDDDLQRFVRSAAQKYQEWDSGKKFLEVDGHPFSSRAPKFLIFIRKSYKDLKKIFMKAWQGQRYIVLGTAGIGKSLFTVFWVCYLATLKKKVVWKFANDEYYLLDFSLEVARGPVIDPTHPALLSVFNDPSSWLIIDGKQKTRLEYKCRMLLACYAKNSNHHEFGKHDNCSTYYLPVWAEAEIIEFCKDFEEHRFKFPGMDVPDMQTALANFKELGGVPRYVLRNSKMQEGKANFLEAVGEVNTKNCLEILSGQFLAYVSDKVLHVFVNEEEDHMPLNKEEDLMSVDKETDYGRCELRFATSFARDAIIQQFNSVGHVEAVSYLVRHMDSQMFGTIWGHLYEMVAHVILCRGGQFKRKRVFEDTADKATEDFDQGKLKFVTFEKVEDLSRLKHEEPSGAYCRPLSLNFESVDAVIVPDTLVQFFRYRKGNYGYKIQGLKELDKALNMENYNVWSCVPKESFEKTKFQNWLNKDGTKCKFRDEETRVLVQKMQQYVVEVDFRNYATESDKDE